MEYIDKTEQIIKFLKEWVKVLQNEISRVLGIDSSKVSKVLKRLERDGIVKRIPVIVDGVQTFEVVYIEDKSANNTKNLEKKKEYWESGREPRPIRITDTINPYPKGTPAYAIIDQIYRATSREQGKTLEELAISVGWDPLDVHRVYYVIMKDRYQVTCMWLCNNRLNTW